MKLIRLECPHCGGMLSVREDETTVTCSYCGKQVAVDDEVKRSETTVHIKDEAKIREAQLNEKRYQDEQRKQEAARQAEQADTYRRSKGGKFVIVLIVLCALGALAGFSGGHPLAGIIAIIQMALLIASRMRSTGHLDTIRGIRIPPIVLTLLACLLIIPYVMITNRKVYQKYTWPDTEAGEILPKPASQYGEILYSREQELSARIDKTKQDAYVSYVNACRENGFTVDADDRLGFEAYNEEGYHVDLSFDASNEEMHIRLDAPMPSKPFTWPISEFSSLLPAPSSARGNIEEDRSDYFEMYVMDMPLESYEAYISDVMAAGFTVDYKRTDTSFQGFDEAGNEAEISYEGHHTIRIRLSAPKEETPEPEETETPKPTPQATPDDMPTPEPEPTEKPEETAKSEAPASGIRPEFRKTMEDYEAFYDEYIAFMEKYNNSSDPAGMMMDYLSLMNRLSEWEKSIDRINEDELSTEELLLYNEVTLRVASKLNAAAIRMG